MLRKKPLIHTLDIISSSLSQVSASSSSSSNRTLMPVLKTLPWLHRRRRSSVAAAERYEFSPSDPNPVGSDIGSPTNWQQRNPNGFYGGNYSRNSVGHQRSDLGNFRSSNKDGIYGENSVTYQMSDLGEATHMNPSGFYIANSAGFQTNSLEMVRQNSGFQTLYRPNEYQSSYGYNSENPVPGGQHNFGDSPFLGVPNINDGESAQNSEICNCKGTLGELDEFSNEGKVKEAVEVLNLLEKNGMVIDLPRYLKLLQACADAGSLEEGRIVHDHISRMMGDVGIGVHNKILDTYSKCGSMADAFQLFHKMPQRNLTSWDTMIMGLANNNLGEEAIDLFLQFNEMG